MRIAALLLGAALLGLSGMVSAFGLRGPLWWWVYEVPGGDVTLHVLLAGAAGFLATRAFAPPRGGGWLRAWRPALIVAAVSAIDEALQLWIPSRSFSLVDLGANLGGIAAFSGLALALRRAR